MIGRAPQADLVIAADTEEVLGVCQSEFASLQGRGVLITGATGFVGSYLARTIVAFNAKCDARERCRLLLPTRSTRAAREKWPEFFDLPDVEWREWDGKGAIPFSDACEYIVHAASPADPAGHLADPYGTMQTIVSGTQQVLEFAKKSGTKSLLYVSSGAVYGRIPANIEAVAESFCGAPALGNRSSCYGEAKRFSEQLCQASGVPTTTARLFSFVGPHQDLSASFAAPGFIRQALSNREIRVHSAGTAVRTYCYISDLTCAMWKLLLNGKAGEAYNVGQGLPAVSILDLARLIATLVGEVRVIVEGRTDSAGEERSRYIPDIARLCKLYRPSVLLEESLSRTLWSLYFQGRSPAPPLAVAPLSYRPKEA